MADPFAIDPASFEPEELQDFLEPWQSDGDEIFSQFLVSQYLPDEAPNYSQVASTLDGLDDATSFTSESFGPSLTLGSTLASSHHLATSPSLGLAPEDTGLYDHGGFNTAQLKERCDNLSAPQLDLQYIGGNPEIHMQEQVVRPLNLPQDVDIPINLSPCTAPNNYGVPPGRRPLASNRPRTRPADPRGPTALAPPTGEASCGEPMRRGRSGGFDEPKRAKVAGMRSTKACERCRIRKVECHPGCPCPQCAKDVPGHPEVCGRTKLVELLPEYGQPSIWLAEPDGDPTIGNARQPTGNPSQAVVTFHHPNTAGPPCLILIVQPYVEKATTEWFAPPNWGYSYPPSSTTFGIVPMSTNGNWPGIWSSLGELQPLGPSLYNYPQGGDTQHCLVPQVGLSTQQLLIWAEGQVLQESARQTSFEAAIQALAFALRDGLLSSHDNNNNNSSNNSHNNRTGGAGQGGSHRSRSTSVRTKPSLLDLLRNVCEMTCWIWIWRARSLYVSGVAAVGGIGGGIVGPPPPQVLSTTALSELKTLALASLVQCERLVLSGLDAFGPSIKGMEVSVWACLLQTIFSYRQMIATYSVWLRNYNEGSGQLVAALDVMQQLHRLLLVKYSAYFWSSSPLHPWPTGPSTAQTLAGDERLRTTWFDVFTRYEGFLRGISASVALEDELLKVLVVDVEQNTERKRRKGQKYPRGRE